MRREGAQDDLWHRQTLRLACLRADAMVPVRQSRESPRFVQEIGKSTRRRPLKSSLQVDRCRPAVVPARQRALARVGQTDCLLPPPHKRIRDHVAGLELLRTVSLRASSNGAGGPRPVMLSSARVHGNTSRALSKSHSRQRRPVYSARPPEPEVSRGRISQFSCSERA
jgi:hypothetical protein